jgi:predicted HTH domain antitoxin
MLHTETMDALLEEEVDALVEGKYYEDREELLLDAVRTLFRVRPKLSVEAAVELYKKSRVTLARAAEIAGLMVFEFKEVLADRGVRIEVPKENDQDISQGVEDIEVMRREK